MGFRFAAALAAATMMLGFATPALAGDPSGEYLRKGKDTVHVWISEGKLYCKITKGSRPNFEMCHGMAPEGEAWKGKHMKHPSMPGFMTFNGTVTNDDKTLKIKGCAIGICDSEVWTKVEPKAEVKTEAKPS